LPRGGGIRPPPVGNRVKHITSPKGPSFYVLCLPRQFAISILQQFHEVSNFHVPRAAMLQHFASRFYTPEIDQLLTASINSCLKCFLTHNSGVKNYKMFKRSISQTCVGEHLQLDLICSLPASSEGYTTLLLMVCVSSHYMIGLPLLDQTAPTISAALTNIFHIIPHPRYISCDHQSSFFSINFFCDEFDILCIKSTPSAKNELGSVDSGCRITTQFLQRITSSLDQTLRLQWPKYTKILFENMNARYSNRNKFPLAPMGVLAPGSAHARPSARPPIDTSGNFSAHVSAESPSNISPIPSKVISDVSDPYNNFF
jgi:hypothetical protein